MSFKRRYAPPDGPPPKAALLKPSSTLPYPIDLEQLANQGWTTLPIQDSPSDPLYSAFADLFLASAQFFNLPDSERVKYRVKPSSDEQVSEEGYSLVEGEKCMIALRKAETTPTEFGMREIAMEAWRAGARVVRDVLVGVEESLGMEKGVLVRTMERQMEMPEEGEGNVATLMRMFRYDRPSSPSSTLSGANAQVESRVVAEPHRDLGLLTIVIGHSPGLECWDAQSNAWVSCETREGLNATILVGQTLAKFTNLRYVPGKHRVFVHPTTSTKSASDSPNSDSSLSNPAYRFSLVHALRAHLPLTVSSSSFQTTITGPYPPAQRFSSARIADIYRAISNTHWNVNVSVEERRRQERALAERALAEREREEKGKGNAIGRRRFSRIWGSVFRRSGSRAASVS